MRLIIFLTVLIFMTSPSYAQLANNIAPQITFTQKVRSIQALKSIPEALGGKIEQSGNDISLELFIKNDLSEDKAKELAMRFIAIVKKNSPDDPIESPLKPSVGRFNYTVVLRKPNGNIAYSGLKPAKDNKIVWAIEPEAKKNLAPEPPESQEKSAKEEQKLEEQETKPISLQEKIKANPDVDPLDIVDFPEKY